MIDITYNTTFYNDVLNAQNIILLVFDTIIRFLIKQNEEVSYHYSSLTLQNY